MSRYSCHKLKPWGRCAKCVGCIAHKSRIFEGRIRAEVSSANGMCAFCTLTYAPAHLPANNKLASEDLTAFLKRIRIQLLNKYGIRNVRFAAVLERGTQGTKRFHWHIIFFGVSGRILRSELSECWRCGFVDVKRFGDAHAGYLAKYVTKAADYGIRYSRGLGHRAIMRLYCREYLRKAKGAVSLSSWYRLGGYWYATNYYLRFKIVHALRKRGVNLVKLHPDGSIDLGGFPVSPLLLKLQCYQ